MLLQNALVLGEEFIFQKSDIQILDGKISHIAPQIAADDETLNLDGKMLLPGLINIHTHGAVGFDSMTCDYDGLNKISIFMAKNGATSFLPTSSTMSKQDILRGMTGLAKAIDRGTDGAQILGIHMEGPYLSGAYKGAHDEKLLRSVRELDFTQVQAAAGGHIKLVTIAPETEGALEFIANREAGIKISLGHTGADFDTCIQGFELGATQITHMFNAMPSIHHRKLSLISAAFAAGAYVEMICDGLHVDPVAVQMAYSMFGDGKVVVVTDSLNAAGMTDGEYTFGGRNIIVSDGIAKLPDGTISGGTSTMWQCVQNLVGWGIPLQSAVKMSSHNPAKAIDVYRNKGSIGAGKDADLLIVDGGMNLQNVMVGGRFVE